MKLSQNVEMLQRIDNLILVVNDSKQLEVEYIQHILCLNLPSVLPTMRSLKGTTEGAMGFEKNTSNLCN